jgi:hypothetical protein
MPPSKRHATCDIVPLRYLCSSERGRYGTATIGSTGTEHNNDWFRLLGNGRSRLGRKLGTTGRSHVKRGDPLCVGTRDQLV